MFSAWLPTDGVALMSLSIFSAFNPILAIVQLHLRTREVNMNTKYDDVPLVQPCVITPLIGYKQF